MSGQRHPGVRLLGTGAVMLCALTWFFAQGALCPRRAPVSQGQSSSRQLSGRSRICHSSLPDWEHGVCRLDPAWQAAGGDVELASHMPERPVWLATEGPRAADLVRPLGAFQQAARGRSPPLR